MTYLEYRMKVSALTAAHRAAVAALTAEYNAIDQSAAKVARAARARSMKGAREWLTAWEAHPELMALIRCTAAELAEAQLACELDPRFVYDANCHKVTKTA